MKLEDMSPRQTSIGKTTCVIAATTGSYTINARWHNYEQTFVVHDQNNMTNITMRRGAYVPCSASWPNSGYTFTNWEWCSTIISYRQPTVSSTQIVGNFINVLWTLATRHHFWQCYHWLNTDTLPPDKPEVGPGTVNSCGVNFLDLSNNSNL